MFAQRFMKFGALRVFNDMLKVFFEWVWVN